MDRIDAMRMFVRVVERRSFAQAAHDLAVPKSRVSEAVQQLEKRLGARLLTRTTRQVSPTQEGMEFFRRCGPILAEVDAAEQVLGDGVPAGLLRIDVHGTFARHFLIPYLPAFLEQHPGVAVHVSEGDAFVDLVREGIDCVVRVGEPADSGLIGRRVGMLDEGTFASPAYLAKYGTPTSLDDLAGHQVIGFLSSKTRRVIPLEFQTAAGVTTVPVPSRVTVNAAETMACLAIHGQGLIQVPRYRLADELRDGLLVEVLAAFAPTPSPVYILHPEGSYLSPRTRAFIDWAADLLSDALTAASAPRLTAPGETLCQETGMRTASAVSATMTPADPAPSTTRLPTRGSTATE